MGVPLVSLCECKSPSCTLCSRNPYCCLGNPLCMPYEACSSNIQHLSVLYSGGRQGSVARALSRTRATHGRGRRRRRGQAGSASGSRHAVSHLTLHPARTLPPGPTSASAPATTSTSWARTSAPRMALVQTSDTPTTTTPRAGPQTSRLPHRRGRRGAAPAPAPPTGARAQPHWTRGRAACCCCRQSCAWCANGRRQLGSSCAGRARAKAARRATGRTIGSAWTC